MSKQLEFNIEYSPEHELAAEKAVVKSAAFEITSESIRTIQNVCILDLILFI
jgi:flagellar basal body rod protein FlgC